MRLKPFLKYFFFVWRNWNLRLALFTLKHELRGERKYGIKTVGYDTLTSQKVLSEKNKKHAYIYQPVNYYAAEKAFSFLIENKAEGAVVDFGCGMGRMLAIAAHFGFKTIRGVEFAPALCEVATANAGKTIERFPDAEITVICNDAAQYEVREDEGIFVFFNPFDRQVMVPVIVNILASARKHPRDLYIVYFNPTEQDVVLSAGFEKVDRFKKFTYANYTIYFQPKESFEDWGG